MKEVKKIEKHFIPGTDGVIYANKDKFSFGIDAILLSDFVKVSKNKILVDIGAGTGIIGLRVNFLNELNKVFLIEIQQENCNLIKDTISENNLSNVFLLNCDMNNAYDKFENSSVDYIVSNPPYKKMNTGLLNKDRNFLISRYEYSLKLEDILKFSYTKLKSKGKLFLIYSMERLVDVLSLSRDFKLEPKRIQFVCSSTDKKPHLFMLELVKNGLSNLFVENTVFIYDKNGDYTDEVKEIYYGKNF
ncbi:MAG: methyltransferase [Peptoniphilaceae bacterium]|uniref:tRNA1(Val) (adenine(37)-N6)-methyltransferase n=1 Tax=Parvimonas sp. TaxID=1944660 RepID=UPI0025E0246B|nr:methyltransferase [Parvimonas sp.]MCI5996638.1 methyltransferase [Parvimonas sp.]MDD7765238.1 methyltransferase [Peptoniphilaceae bacterium]MDY3051320.1 methyltransferase [Parvimonas sp.]